MSGQLEVVIMARKENGMNILMLTDEQFEDIAMALKHLNAKRDRDNRYYAKNKKDNVAPRETRHNPRFTVSNVIPITNL